MIGRWPIIRRVVTDGELREGVHVHTANHLHGEVCQGGDSECALWQQQLDEAIQTWSGS